MPTTRATLSLVPNSETARSFNDAANRSMNAEPTEATSDGWPPPASPTTSSPAANAEPAAATPARAAQPAGTSVSTGGAGTVSDRDGIAHGTSFGAGASANVLGGGFAVGLGANRL